MKLTKYRSRGLRILSVLLLGTVAACGGDDEGPASDFTETTTAVAPAATEPAVDDAATGTWSTEAVTLQVGDCFREIESSGSWDAEVVSCSEAHDGEVYAVNRDDFGVDDRGAKLVEAIRSYVGLGQGEGVVGEFMNEHGLMAVSNWELGAGFLHYLALDPERGGGPLTEAYRATG